MGCIIDDFKDVFGMWRKSLEVDGERFRTRSGVTWEAMNSRCKTGGTYQERATTYIGCTTSEAFKDFQLFTNWSRSQVGFDLSGYALDKDVLSVGNKVYSENFCVFIPQALNNFLVKRAAKRGEYPLGVQLHRGLFRADIRIDGVQEYLGLFKTPEEAHLTYKVAKEAEARRWYERLKAGEFIVDPRVIERLRTWKLEVE